MKNEKCTLKDLEFGDSGAEDSIENIVTTIIENEKHPLDDLKNDEITKKREK